MCPASVVFICRTHVPLKWHRGGVEDSCVSTCPFQIYYSWCGWCLSDVQHAPLGNSTCSWLARKRLVEYGLPPFCWFLHDTACRLQFILDGALKSLNFSFADLCLLIGTLSASLKPYCISSFWRVFSSWGSSAKTSSTSLSHGCAEGFSFSARGTTGGCPAWNFCE